MRHARLGIREKRAKHEQDAIKKKSSVNKQLPRPLQFRLWTLFSLTCCEKRLTINYFFLFSCFFRLKDHPRSPNWTLDFEPTFSQRVYFPLSPRSLFPTRQRFPIPNHVTSGCMSPPSLFSHWSAVSPLKNTWLPVPVMTSSLHQNEAHLAQQAPFTTEGLLITKA